MAKESDFQDEIARSAVKLGMNLSETVSYFKIPDSPRGAQFRFMPTKAFDFFLVYRGRIVAVESKVTHGPSIAFGALRDIQEDSLFSVFSAEGKALVLVNFRTILSAREANKRGVDKVNEAFAVSINNWIKWRIAACSGTIQLTTFEDPEHSLGAVRVPRINIGGDIGWDLTPLLPTTP